MYQPFPRHLAVLSAIALTMLTTLACGGTGGPPGATDAVLNFDDGVAPWLGRPGDDVLRTWGKPEDEIALSSGGRILIYSQNTKIDPGKALDCRQQGPGNNDATCTVSGDNSFTLGCQTDFELTAVGLVVRANRRGPLCVAASLPLPSAAPSAPSEHTLTEHADGSVVTEGQVPTAVTLESAEVGLPGTTEPPETAAERRERKKLERQLKVAERKAKKRAL